MGWATGSRFYALAASSAFVKWLSCCLGLILKTLQASWQSWWTCSSPLSIQYSLLGRHLVAHPVGRGYPRAIPDIRMSSWDGKLFCAEKPQTEGTLRSRSTEPTGIKLGTSLHRVAARRASAFLWWNLLFNSHSINNIYRTDGRPIFIKLTCVKGRQGQPLFRFEKTPPQCFSMRVQKWLFHFCYKQ